ASEHDAVLRHDDAPREDPIRERLTAIFAGRVGNPLPESEMPALLARGRDRYDRKVPPGFRDLGEKADQFAFGDFLLWEEVLRKAAEESRPALLVTEERKDDWWTKHEGMLIGPRPELISEFEARTNQHF